MWWAGYVLRPQATGTGSQVCDMVYGSPAQGTTAGMGMGAGRGLGTGSSACAASSKHSAAISRCAELGSAWEPAGIPSVQAWALGTW